MTHHTQDLGDDVHASLNTDAQVMTLETVAGARIALRPGSFAKLFALAVKGGPQWLGPGGGLVLPVDPTPDPLTRIADLLEAASKGDTSPDLRAGVFRLGQDFAAGIEQVAFSIGQQIRRGSDAG